MGKKVARGISRRSWLLSVVCCVILFCVLRIAIDTEEVDGRMPATPRRGVLSSEEHDIVTKNRQEVADAVREWEESHKGRRLADVFEITGSRVASCKEFQLKLDHEEWADRPAALQRYMEALRRLSPFAFDDGAESVRMQEMLDTKNCETDRNIRIRSYLQGPTAGSSTIDLKVVSQKGLHRIASVDFLRPAPQLEATCVQKVEQDVHPCKADKWSKETRVTGIKFQPKLRKCADLLLVFPDIFSEEIVTRVGEEKLLIKRREYWWVYSHEGVLDLTRFNLKGQLKWKSAFTLRYETEEDARTNRGGPYPRGEWSLRLWSSADGVGEWNEEALALVYDVYAQLLDDLGSLNEWPCEDAMAG